MREDYLYWKFNWEWFGSLILLNNTLREVNALLKPTVVRNYTYEFIIKNHRKGMSLIMKLCVYMQCNSNWGLKKKHIHLRIVSALSLFTYMVLAWVVSCFSHVQLFATPQTVVHEDSLSMGFWGKNTGVGCHFLHQGIFLTQESNLGLLSFRWIIYRAT